MKKGIHLYIEYRKRLKEMKKSYFLATSALAVFALAACSDTATPVTGTQDESSLTLQEVFDKAIERQQSINSVHAIVKMNQEMEMDFNGQSMKFTTVSNFEMDAQQSPLAMFMTGTVAMDMGGDMMEMPLEMYMTEADGFYMLNAEMNEWMKLPENQYEQLLAQTGAQADATEQLEQLKQFIDDFEFKQDDKNYLLTLNIKGDKFKEFIVGQLDTSLGESTELSGEDLQSMSFENSKYDLVINKETFDTEEINMDLTMLMDMEGQQSKISNDATIKYSQFDQLDEINIPTEVKNKAISE